MNNTIDPTAFEMARRNDVLYALPRDRMEGDARLLALASWLTNMPRTHRFQLTTESKGACDAAHPCGSRACAMGSAPMVFPGLVRTIVGDWGSKWEASGVAIVSRGTRSDGTRDGVEQYDNVAQVLFGISNPTAIALFGAGVGMYDDADMIEERGVHMAIADFNDPMVVVCRIENYMRGRYKS